MKKRYLPTLLFAALLSLGHATAQSTSPQGLTGYAAQAAAASQSLTQRVETWGDWFGTEPSTPMPTSVVNYYYDTNNRLQATAKYSNMAGDSETTVEVEYEGYQMPLEYATYHYDDKGNLTDVKLRKYGNYDGIFMGWSDEVSTSEHNEYDADNHLVYQRSATTGSHAYTWQGHNLVEQSDTSLTKGTWSQTIVYADFLEGADNCPQTVYTVNTWKQKYQGKYVYDAQHRPVTYTLWQVTQADVDDAHHMTNPVLSDNPYSQEEWAYGEDGRVASVVTSYWNSSSKGFQPSTKVTYTTQANGSRKESQYSWNNASNDWAVVGGDVVTYESAYVQGSAPTDLVAHIATDAVNTVSLEAALPEDAPADAVWKVYRNGFAVGEAQVADGKITYSDTKLKNGAYTYFLQCKNGDQELNVSNEVAVRFSAELNAPRNLHVVSTKQVDGKNGKEWQVTVAWDAPEAKDGFTLRGYNVYADVTSNTGNEIPDNFDTTVSLRKEELLSEPTYTFTWDGSSNLCHTVQAEAVYADYGRVMSQPVVFKLGATPQLLLKERAMYGDAMGAVEDDTKTKKTDYYYDSANHLVREVTRARVLGDDPNTPEVERVGDWKETSYTMYNYSPSGNLLNVSTREYKVQQGYKTDWTDADTTNVYQYDDQNRRIEDLALKGYKRTVYAWDGTNLVGETQYNSFNGTLIYDMQYRDFVEGKENLPQLVIKDGVYDSNKRLIEQTYDAQGHMLSRKSYKYGDVERDADGKVTTVEKGTPDLEETWTYDAEGNLTLYLKRKWNTSANDYVNASKTVYTKRTDGIYEEPFTYTKNGDFWSPGRPYLNVYVDYYQGVEPGDFKATVDKQKVNTVTFTASRPTDTWGSSVYYLCRNGKRLGEATLNARRTTLTYTDQFVPNGQWDYYLESDNALGGAVGMNVTVPINVEFHTDFPAVTDIHAESYSKDDDNYHLALAWQAPELSDSLQAAGLQLQGYNIYADVTEGGRLPAPENENVVLTQPAFDFEWSVEAPATQTVMVEAVYNVGTKLSAIASFDVDQLISGINQASGLDPKAVFTFEGRTLHLQQPCREVQVIDASGRLCQRSAQSSTVSLATLPVGTYVVTARQADGRRVATKVVLK